MENILRPEPWQDPTSKYMRELEEFKKCKGYYDMMKELCDEKEKDDLFARIENFYIEIVEAAFHTGWCVGAFSGPHTPAKVEYMLKQEWMREWMLEQEEKAK